MYENETQMEKLYYTIGEVAKMFNVNISLIRFWEKEFTVIKPHRNKKGNRLFTQHDVDLFHQIYHLVKERGYTLDGAKEKLKTLKLEEQGVDPQTQILFTLKKAKSFLIELKSSLDTLEKSRESKSEV